MKIPFDYYLTSDLYVDVNAGSVLLIVFAIAAFIWIFLKINKKEEPDSSYESGSGSSSGSADTTSKGGSGRLHSFKTDKEPSIPPFAGGHPEGKTSSSFSEKSKRAKPRNTSSRNIKHSLEILYKYSSSGYVWKCPDCDAENSIGTDRCCICNKIHNVF